MPVGESMPVRDDETMLAAMVRSGFLYRFGCKRGGCGVCKVHLVAGEVRYERPIAPTVLSDTERAAGVCLSCRAVPLTDVIIALQEGDRLILASPLLREAAKRAAAREKGGKGESAVTADERG
jgi:CDP-4-dehydro-6-deoxyglucose reductase